MFILFCLTFPHDMHIFGFKHFELFKNIPAYSICLWNFRICAIENGFRELVWLLEPFVFKKKSMSCFNINLLSLKYKISHCGEKMVIMKQSYDHLISTMGFSMVTAYLCWKGLWLILFLALTFAWNPFTRRSHYTDGLVIVFQDFKGNLACNNSSYYI